MNKLKRSKWISILLVSLICLSILLNTSGCVSNLNKSIKEDIHIGLIAQDFKDASFGELSKKGIEEAKEKIKIVPEYFETKGDKKLIDNGLEKVSENSEMIIAVGADMKAAIEKVARERRDRSFTIIDSEVEEVNVKSVLFRHQEGAFLMGIVAGNETKSNKVGFIGGVNDEIGMQFLNGYAAGIKTVNEKAASGVLDGSNVRFVQSLSDEKKAYEKAIELYDEGCDIIFQAAGKSGFGVFKAAKEKNKKVIGVGTDQRVTVPEYKDQIISSMIKSIDKTTVNLCESVKRGSFKSGSQNMQQLGIKEKMIDYAPSTSEAVSKKTMEDLKKYKQKIKTEEIKIPTMLYEVMEFKAD